MAKRKMKVKGECPHCMTPMVWENGENGSITEYWWECKCGRAYDLDGKDITDYTCSDIS